MTSSARCFIAIAAMMLALGPGCSDPRPQIKRNPRPRPPRQVIPPTDMSKVSVDSEFQKQQDASAFRDVLGSHLTGIVDGKKIPVDVYDVGKLDLSTGQILACDGIIRYGDPFVTTVPPGSYPVLLAIARMEEVERIAFARVNFTSETVSRWSLALRPGQDPAQLKPNHLFGYSVDSGNGCFADPAVIDDLRGIDRSFFDTIEKHTQKVYRGTRDWVRIKTPHGSIIRFTAGYGDGHYPSWFGYDASGNVASLVTEFNVLEWHH